MNRIIGYGASIPQYFFSVVANLSTKQKQILIISAVAMSIFAIIAIAYNCCCTSDPSSVYSPSVPPKYSPPPQSTFIPPSPPSPPKSTYFPSKPTYDPAKPTYFPTTATYDPSKQTYFPTTATFGHVYSDSDSDSDSPLTQTKPFNPVTFGGPSFSHPEGPRAGLRGVEDKINQLQDDLQTERFTLGTVKDEDDEIKLQIESRIFNLQKELEDVLKTYPDMLSKYLEEKFSGYQAKDSQDIYERLAFLSGFLQNNSDNQVFVHNSLKKIDEFLSQTFFTSVTELCLQEEKKVDLIVFHEFFTIVDNHLAIVEKKDSQLAVRLKVKLANLPLRDDVDPITQLPVPIDRKVKFPNVHLSERNQVTILVSHFQSEEDKNLATFIANLPSQAKFSDKDIKKLTRMAVKGTSHLSNANMLQLQNALKNKLGSHAPINWDDFNKVQNAIMSYNHGAFFGYFGDSAQVVALHQASKAKKYFERQLGLPEDQIQIPRWYHATKHNQGGCNYLSDIIKAGQINVEHRQAFKGAWVSTQREWEFGNSVFVFNHRIAKLDPNVFIGYEKGKVRWRGLQYAIPLLDASKVSYLSLIGLYQGADKMVKADVKQKLENKNIKNLTIVSVELVDYIQREIIKTIGNPNLSEKWWGKADFSYLEKPLT